MEASTKRRARESFAELDRIVSGTSWGVSIAFDTKKRVVHKWESIRRKALRDSGEVKQNGLTGEALDAAVMALATADPSLVGFEPRGAR